SLECLDLRVLARAISCPGWERKRLGRAARTRTDGVSDDFPDGEAERGAKQYEAKEGQRRAAVRHGPSGGDEEHAENHRERGAEASALHPRNVTFALAHAECCLLGRPTSP